MRLTKYVFILMYSFSLFSGWIIFSRKYDFVIKNGLIIDGSGNPWFMGDVGIIDKEIKKVGVISEKKAKKIIDAKNLIVCPGFIDIHTHADRGILEVPTAYNYVLQGVTSVIGGNCGGSVFPLKEFFKKIKNTGISLNFGSLVGHNTIRKEVMGLKMADPTEEEMNKMMELLEKEMKSGALGLSTGLAYMPGVYSKTEELVKLGMVVAKHNGIYASHIRNQGKYIEQAIEEAILIGEKNKIPVEISHVKLADEVVWGEIDKILKPILNARRRGIEVTTDQYPYTATSSGFSSSFPSWALEGGREKFIERIKDNENYKRIRDTIINNRLTSQRGINKLQGIYIVSYPYDRAFEGRNLEEILDMIGKKPTIENAADLIIEIEKNGGAQAIFFQMDEKDVEEIMKLPFNMIGSDGGVIKYGEGFPHPRSYGTFPRILSKYVREKNMIELEDAIRKMTSLPAQTLRLEKRGMIKEGYFADIVIFDPERIKDRADFSSPHRYPEGIKYVFVNGEIVAENGNHTRKFPGMILYGKKAD
ncbi:MAG: D-aminoacylase [Acidobacteriota bacterium]